MTSGQKKCLQFWKKYASSLAPALKDTNIFIATAVAQKCLESGFGTSPLAVNYNNFGGIKGRPAYSSGKTSEGWAIFPSAEACFKSYATFINTVRTNYGLRYEKALNANSPEDQIYWMVYAGYCSYPDMTLEQGARYYLSKCKGFVSILNQKGIGGKVGLGGLSISSLINTNLEI